MSASGSAAPAAIPPTAVGTGSLPRGPWLCIGPYGSPHFGAAIEHPVGSWARLDSLLLVLVCGEVLLCVDTDPPESWLMRPPLPMAEEDEYPNESWDFEDEREGEGNVEG